MSTDTDEDPPPYARWTPEGSLTAIVGPNQQVLWNPSAVHAQDTGQDGGTVKTHATGVEIDEDLFVLLNTWTNSRLLAPDGSREKLERALRRVPVLEDDYRSVVAYLPHGEFLVARVRDGMNGLRLYHRPADYQLPWLHLIDHEHGLVEAWFGTRKALIHNVPLQDRAVLVHATTQTVRESGPVRIGWVREQMTRRVTHEPYGDPVWRPRTFHTVPEAGS